MSDVLVGWVLRGWDAGARDDTARESTRPDAEHTADLALAARIRHGDAAAYEQLFLRLYAPLVRFATSFVTSREAAEEIVADLFAAVWDHRDTWTPPRVEAYFYRAVRNRALNVVRDTARQDTHRARLRDAAHELAAHPSDTPADALETDERIHQIRAAIARLSERQRTILTLRWDHELPWDAIAATLGVSVSAAQTDHTRALRALRAYLPADLRD